MKFIILFCSQLYIGSLFAQNQPTSSNIVDGGKVLIELVKVFKKSQAQKDLHISENNLSDICFTNSTPDNLYIELSKKINDTTYRNLPSAISLTNNAHECLLELPPNVYHYKVYKKINGIQSLSLEGDIRLLPNEKMEREIK